MRTHRLHRRHLLAAFFLLISLCSAASARERSHGRRPQLAVPGEGVILHSSRSTNSFKAASADTFYLYGGPGSLLGKFQTASGGPDRQGWTSHDETDRPPFWHPSTFNSPTGTMAMWAGQSAAQQPGWLAAPGYGNLSRTHLSYRATVSNPAVGQTVVLDFVFNHDSEPGYDYFDVEYDSMSVAKRVYHRDGNNKDTGGNFIPVQYADVAHDVIVYGASSYGGPGADEISIRLVFESDAAWSDEDGLFDSDGAVQVDEISVTHLDGVDFEDFEGPSTSFHWTPSKAPYAGDFGNVFILYTDLDPCRSNRTPAIGFIDDGRGPFNPDYDGTGTGGSTSSNWNYGVPGGYVVNHDGGISGGAVDLANYWWSPEIDWDLPGPEDDGPKVEGAKCRFSIWRHEPALNGQIYDRGVRGYSAATGWSNWSNRGWIYWPPDGDWLNFQFDVTNRLPPDREKLQIRLGVLDLAHIWAFPGTDSTPAPLFDNVAVAKYEIGGPTITTRTIDLFQDSFSQSGATDVSTAPARDLLDVRVDMARDINTGIRLNVPGDSLYVDVKSVLPGVGRTDSLNQTTLHYSLNLNPLFEAGLRANAPLTQAGSGTYGWDQHEGHVTAEQTFTSAGAIIPDRFFFDLPDADFMYPGDVLEYYIRAEDDNGNASTLPADLSGFDDTALSYDRMYTVRALPTYTSTDGSTPQILFWNDFGRWGGEVEALAAFSQNGLIEGIHFDSYTTQGPSSRVSNGLGSAGAHGATSAQLHGYRCIITEHGSLSYGLISSGSNSGADDKSDDAGTLMGWWAAEGEDRAIAHFGDNLASSLITAGSANDYLSTVINADLIAADVRLNIGEQTVPLIRPAGLVSSFMTSYFADGSCPMFNRFDSVTPRPGAVVGHEFMDVTGTTPLANASIYNSYTDGLGGTHQSLLFPYGLVYVQHPTGKLPSGASARSVLLEEILTLFGGAHFPPPGPFTAAPRSRRELRLVAPYPNPFNPQIKLAFTLGRAAHGRVDVYDLRGAHVTTIAKGDFSAGRNELSWKGRDDAGKRVASGVYLVRYAIDGFEESQKIVLIE